MKRTALIAGLTATVSLGLAQPALAHEDHAPSQRYSGSATHTECRKSSGATGLAAGGVAGGLVGAGISGGGLLGTLIGVVGGAVAGRAIDRNSTKSKRCSVVQQDEPRQHDYVPPVDRDDLYEDGPSER